MKKEIARNLECDCNCIHFDKVDKAKIALEEVNMFDKLEMFFKNFSDDTRLKILTILDSVGQMCVCDIAVSLNMTKSAISHQLKYLKLCNLIKSVKVGKEVFYSLSDNHVKEIIECGIEHLQEDK
jgi:ArsR family transcriptional regulator